jgi:hypothetical protein
MGEGWGDPSGKAVATEGGAGKAPTGPLMRFTEARNDKPPGGGGLTRVGDDPTLILQRSAARDGRLERGYLTCQPSRME